MKPLSYFNTLNDKQSGIKIHFDGRLVRQVKEYPSPACLDSLKYHSMEMT